MSKIIILGINWEQNSSASLMIDGKIVSGISEERFTRKKNDESYPKNAIEYVLKTNNINYIECRCLHICIKTPFLKNLKSFF